MKLKDLHEVQALVDRRITLLEQLTWLESETAFLDVQVGNHENCWTMLSDKDLIGPPEEGTKIDCFIRISEVRDQENDNVKLNKSEVLKSDLIKLYKTYLEEELKEVGKLLNDFGVELDDSKEGITLSTTI